MFCKQNNIKLSIVDAGVNYDFAPNANLVSAKVGKEQNPFIWATMSKTEFDCVLKGKSVVETIAKTGSNCIALAKWVLGIHQLLRF
jgi:nicotinate-nucleotide--dimethylbenzimidazole phosphoribosyltransferase